MQTAQETVWMISRIRTFIKEKQMIQPKDRILVGISGGPDSVCLLFVLLELKKELDFEVFGVHVNHGLRGAESDQDEQFVRTLCEQQKLSLQVHRCAVKERAEREKISLEEAGRLCRYEVFEEDAKHWNCNRIAVAHHANDQAETMLFHLFRGTGIKGLAAMDAVRGAIIRPLLCVERKEILAWLEERKLSWCVDSTNEEEQYTRNRIRCSILPCAQTYINERSVSHMTQTAEELSEIEAFLEEETEKAFRLCVRQEETGCLVFAQGFGALHAVIQGRLLRKCLGLQDGLRDVDRRHIRLLQELMEKRTGSCLDLPGDRVAEKRYEGLWIGRAEPRIKKGITRKASGPQSEGICCSSIPGTCEAGGFTWVFSLENVEKYELIPEKTYTKWFDYDKIEQCLEIRGRLPGDYLEINREHGTKKLKDYLINEKVPARERDELVLLADGNHILWIPGRRISEKYKVTEKTRKILKVQLYGGKENG